MPPNTKVVMKWLALCWYDDLLAWIVKNQMKTYTCLVGSIIRASSGQIWQGKSVETSSVGPWRVVVWDKAARTMLDHPAAGKIQADLLTRVPEVHHTATQSWACGRW